MDSWAVTEVGNISSHFCRGSVEDIVSVDSFRLLSFMK